MDNPSLQSASWYQATPLVERLAARRAAPPISPEQIDAALAERRLKRWRSQTPFTDEARFAQRLEMDQLSVEELRHLLGEPAEAIRRRHTAPLAWVTQLEEAFARPPADELLPLPPSWRDQKAAGFLNLIEPLILQARERLQAQVQELRQAYSDLPFDPNTVVDLLYVGLPGRLFFMVTRTLVLELNVERLQGLLQGETPEERFQHFAERLRQREAALAILQEYPVLARQLVVWTNQWLNFSGEFLRHLCADWAAIKNLFCPESDPGVLSEIDAGAGDRHGDGRAVAVVKFSSGFRLVYKPKSLAVDIHFQELLEWLNARGGHPPFRTVKLLDRQTYGWTEFVSAGGCTSTDEIVRFYERQGGYLALLYALEATDFHHENLIAAGEHPVLIDLESLFHPRAGGVNTRESEAVIGETFAHSVMRVGLLPVLIWGDEESEGVEISGLGGSPGQLTPKGVLQWEGAGTDEMHFVRKRVQMPASQNRPNLNGADVNVLNYAEAITTGFRKVYRLLLERRDELLADDGPLARFAGDEVRAILRATRTYALLLQESFHSDVLQDALERERLFDRLWAPIENQAYLSRIIPAERADLWRNDVPMFITRPDTRDVWSSTGERIADFFDEPALNLTQRRLHRISEDDLKQQLWFIHASLTTLEMGEKHAARFDSRSHPLPPQEPSEPASPENLLAAACAAGDRLEALALRGEQDAAWLGVALIRERSWSLMPSGVDLYDGLPGIALFLAYLGKITGQDRYTLLAQEAMTTLRRQIERAKSMIKGIGAFGGWGGLIYTLSHLAALWDQPETLAEAESFIEQALPLIERDESFDIIGGVAGCIGSLISLYRCTPSASTLATAVRCGEHLLARAQPMPQGLGWASRAAEKPLSGFSHGAAGIAWALLKLAALTGEERFRAAALDSIAYERTLFSPEVGNWLDLRDYKDLGRDVPENEQFMVAWCHGAPGIGLGRLNSLPHLDDAHVRAEIDAAIRTTLDRGFGGNYSLCHGDLGNLEFLLQASESLSDPQLRERVYSIAATILKRVDKIGWICGVPLGVETPGLMVGLAGIGYELLRLADPVRVPSILTLAPPHISNAPNFQMNDELESIGRAAELPHG